MGHEKIRLGCEYIIYIAIRIEGEWEESSSKVYHSTSPRYAVPAAHGHAFTTRFELLVMAT